MIKKRISLLLFYYFTGCLLSYAQTQRICATPEHDKYLRSVNPAYAKERDEMEDKIAAYKASHIYQRNSAATLVIPVVVHIVWNTAEQNLSDEQIISQIDVLNEDYSITNANIAEVPSVWANLVGSSHIFFSLARRDENQLPTTGIVRRQTDTVSFDTGDEMKYNNKGGSNAWDRNHFLNIWVCNLENAGQDILGYAEYPTSVNSETDGIVINYQAFGRLGSNLKPQYNLGRTATHEIGHWLNLQHTWGDDAGACNGNDNIDDTPNQGDATYGCPSYPHVSCANEPDGDMFMNYMDYTDDKCMMLFTTDQRSRMDAAITTFRDTLYDAASYAESVTPLATDLRIREINSPAGVVCNKNIDPVLNIKNAGTNTISSFSVDYSVDGDTLQYDWSGTLAPGAELNLTLPEILISEELHTFIVNVISVNGGSDDYKIDNFKTRSFLYAPGKYDCPDYPETPDISIYPTAASESILIVTKYKDTGQKTILSIYNVLGKKMYSREYVDSQGQSVNVYVGGLANGVYFAEVKTYNKQVSKKFVVRHQ
ncbi:MAG TPA: M43 family zinc metalloprotease [Bacteroidia bacterium]|nr:M43 family zinc metalloprotease [Bacteroidia bacterium]